MNEVVSHIHCHAGGWPVGAILIEHPSEAKRPGVLWTVVCGGQRLMLSPRDTRTVRAQVQLLGQRWFHWPGGGFLLDTVQYERRGELVCVFAGGGQADLDTDSSTAFLMALGVRRFCPSCQRYQDIFFVTAEVCDECGYISEDTLNVTGGRHHGNLKHIRICGAAAGTGTGLPERGRVRTRARGR